jgi:sugar/nucleoside kinase (ribokinase family)
MSEQGTASGQPATTPRGRLLVSGSILVDLMLKVATLPKPGGDILTQASEFTVGGGFNVLVAAHRQGMLTAYAGRIGTGPLGEMVAKALDEVGAERLIDPVDSGDSGFCVVMVDDSAERTMMTSMGVDAELTSVELDSLGVNPDDIVYVSGYDLAYPHGPVLARWLLDIDAANTVIFDPGPLVAEIPADLLDGVLGRATWLSLNASEALTITATSDHAQAAARILVERPTMHGVVIRDGANGCLLKTRNGDCVQVPGVLTEVLDTTGAGDCHVGAFAAALASGRAPDEACSWANAAAAIAVSRWGPATGPTYAETASAVALSGA